MERSDDRAMASGRVVRPSVVFAVQMRLQRERKGWSQRQLAESLDQLGVHVHQTTIARWEGGERRLLLDEALAICIALDLSPVHMLSGSYLHAPSAERLIAVGPETAPVAPREMRMWIRGERPLEGQDERRFWAEAARDEWHAMQRTGLRQLREDIQLLTAAWAEGDHRLVEQVIGSIDDELKRQRRSLEREAQAEAAITGG